MRLRVVAYYTNDAYAMEAEKLRLSLGELNIPYRIYRDGLAQWSWDEAVRWKPSFCLRELRKAAKDGLDGILYVDADAIFRSIPEWSLIEKWDFGAHWFQRSKHHAVEILTGTLWFRVCNHTDKLLQAWVEATGKIGASPTPEQHSLHLVLRNREIVMGDLGPEWVYIFDDFKKIYPHVRPVIEHFQASRRLRK